MSNRSVLDHTTPRKSLGAASIFVEMTVDRTGQVHLATVKTLNRREEGVLGS